MAAAKPKLADLSDGDRQVLESWLVEFDQQWGEGLLEERVGRIPPDSSWRLPALAEMVKIDLERHWQRGQQISLEAYLAKYPELGNPADVTADLIHAEYEIRRQFGAPADLPDYARRFPRQVEELRRRIAQGGSSLSGRSWVSGRSSAPGAPGPSPAGRRPGEAARLLPEQLGRYRILKRLGQGGMGSVYLAEDTRLKRSVALKSPLFGPEDGPEVLERFYREATAAATLDHPYLCPVYDVGEIDGIHYLAMAYIEGQSLAASVRGDSGQPQRQVAALVGKLALAMQQAHAKKVIHRDLKPANIMIKTSGRRREPVIVDFGLACQQDAPDVRVTKTGQVLGTLAYMSPEQLRGNPKAVGPACDIYALGVILYELLTGQLPFGGMGLAIVGQILTQPPLPPSKLRPDLNPRLEAICLKAMAKEAGDRYASMAELAAALTDFLRAETTSPAAPASRGPASAPQPQGGESQKAGSSTLVDQFLARVAAEQAAIPILDPKPQPAPRRPASAGRRPPWLLIVAAAAFGVVLLGVIIYVATDKGRIKIVIDDPKAVVRIDLGEVRIEELGEPIRLRAGEHMLTIRRGDAETESRTFVVHRGDNEPLRIEYEADVMPSSPRVITNSLGMKLVLIPAGEFQMGSPDLDSDAFDDEKPQHRVRISRPFYLGVHEVTQGQYRAVTGQSPSNFKGSDDLPVEQVSWNDAVAFCNSLSVKEGLAPCYRISGTEVSILGGSGYRMPTEAEWEYACRAGSTTHYSFGDDATKLGGFAWWLDNSRRQTHPVGQKAPNAWGLHDMHGNVWEWCWDGYDAGNYGQSPGADPAGPLQASTRVIRGGSWDSRHPRGVRSAIRTGSERDSRNNYYLGFRVARVPSGP